MSTLHPEGSQRQNPSSSPLQALLLFKVLHGQIGRVGHASRNGPYFILTSPNVVSYAFRPSMQHHWTNGPDLRGYEFGQWWLRYHYSRRAVSAVALQPFYSSSYPSFALRSSISSAKEGSRWRRLASETVTFFLPTFRRLILPSEKANKADRRTQLARHRRRCESTVVKTV